MYNELVQQPICQQIQQQAMMERALYMNTRIVDKKMQELRDRKHRQTLSEIKTKTHSQFQSTTYHETPKLNRYSSTHLENKNLEIEKQNIKLFNKIASIIREKPRVATQSSMHVNSVEESSSKIKKKQYRIKTENEVLQRRIQEQKPTIQNRQFYRDRLKNIKYLKIIGKFPYDPARKPDNYDSSFNLNSIRSINDSEHPTNVQIYRKQTDQFTIKILKTSAQLYTFQIKIEGEERVLQYSMKRHVYEDQLMKCGYNYDAMLGQLRTNDRSEISFQMLADCLQPGASQHSTD